jgi:hypothetical protein
MASRQRLKQLEKNSVNIQAVDTRELKRVISANGNKFYIDGVSVDYSVYEKAETAQIKSAKARGELDGSIHVRIIGLENIAEGGDE